MADQHEEDIEPDPPDLRQLTADLRQLTAIVTEQTDSLQVYRQENVALQQEITNLRTSSPATVNDEKKLTKLISTSVTEALTAKADNNLRVMLPEALAALMQKRPYDGSSPSAVLWLQEFDDTFLYSYRAQLLSTLLEAIGPTHMGESLKQN